MSKKQKFKLTVKEGWYSEAEMKDELGWSQPVPQICVPVSKSNMVFPET